MLFSKTLFPGEVLDDEFCVESLFAEGGYATVFSGFRLSDDTPVVIKCPRDGVERFDEVTYLRFEREAKAAMVVHHPNIVRTFGFGHHPNGVPYIIMERLDGVQLTDLVQSGPHAREDVLEIICQILRALDAAHAQGLVHRDLKPSNVMVLVAPQAKLAPPYRIKLIDFGLVKPLESASNGFSRDITRSDHMVGTPGYMAPEQIMQEPISPAADIYSAGVIGYELMTGKQAFAGDRHNRMMLQSRGQFVSAPTLVKRDPMLEVLERMMARAPSDRYGSANEAIAALERARRRGTWRRKSGGWWAAPRSR